MRKPYQIPSPSHALTSSFPDYRAPAYSRSSTFEMDTIRWRWRPKTRRRRHSIVVMGLSSGVLCRLVFGMPRLPFSALCTTYFTISLMFALSSILMTSSYTHLTLLRIVSMFERCLTAFSGTTCMSRQVSVSCTPIPSPSLDTLCHHAVFRWILPRSRLCRTGQGLSVGGMFRSFLGCATTTGDLLVDLGQ